ncbi:hybrid sensor histidine kinase/response regulator [Caulobacter soli]|uniref:hybrid sensor histidine kinase/response regulator n=1 Tax=Caulobacter soli TaxID=2708539 RepID=UPI00196B620F|nr:PAS domain-containing sensor histidine kinase [Caulobacter soli]
MPFRVAHFGDEGSAGRLRAAADVSTEPFEILAPEARAVDADIFVFGPAARDPLAQAGGLLKSHPMGQVLFLLPADRLDRFRGSLPFVPHMASAWTADIASSPQSLAGLLSTAAQTGAHRAAMATMHERINRQLTLGGGRAKAENAEELRRQQLSLSEDYLATLLSQAPDAFIALSLSGGVIAWNEAATNLFGPSSEMAIGRDAESVFPIEMRGELSELIALGRRGQAFTGREIAFSTLGGRRWAELSLAPVRDDSGRVVTLSITIRDVTERQRIEDQLRDSEARYRTLIETLPQLVWTCSPDGACTYLSRQWVEYTGVPEAQQLGMGWVDRVIHPDDRSRTVEHWLGAVAGHHPYDIDYRIQGRDGVYRWFKTRGTPIRDEDNAIIEWFGTCTDIEEIVAARETLARSAEQLENQVALEIGRRAETEEALRQAQKMEAVGQLTGGIAHDFNNLLQGIVGSLELVQKRIGEGRTGDLMRLISGAVSSADRAAALTHRLLAFSRRQPLDPKPVKVNPLVSSMEDLLRRTLGEQVELELVLAGGLWSTLCDAHQLESAILNLAINARDAMPDGGKLIIETANTHLDVDYASRIREISPGQYVCVSVSDTGTGMSPEVVARAFDPFYTTKPMGQGTGLGLSMIYGFARQSEGLAKIYSEPGDGTCVKLYLPRYRGAPGVSDEPVVIAVHAEPLAASTSETVLIIEDEPIVRGLALEVLGELGYRTLEAGDGPAGLAILRSAARIDLLITDIGLPGGLNGRQVADAARVLRPDLKVLLMTGYAENAALAKGVLEPGMSMITKPFAMDVLTSRVRSILGE